MAENRAELVFPFGGLNDSEAQTDAPEGTTSEAVNVRAYDPVTGRRRGSQRSGTVKYSPTRIGTGRVQALGTVAFDNTRLNYKLNDPPTADTTIITPAKGTAYAVVVDPQNNVWAYDGSKTLVKYNPEGVLLETISVAIHHIFGVITRLRLDEFGALYASTIASGTSSVQKYSEDEDRGWTQQWGLVVEGSIRDFDIVNDMLYVTVDYGQYGASGGTSYIRTYAGLAATVPPLEVWQKDVPHPVHGIQTVSDGSVYFTCPQNLNRVFQNPDTGDFNVPVIDWTPGHLTNAASRIHYWIDASDIAESTSGISDRVNIPTINSLLSRNATYNSWESTDTTQRVFASPQGTWISGDWPDGFLAGTWTLSWARSSPRYHASHWGSMPALRSMFGYAGGIGETLTYNFPEIPGDCMVSGHNTHDLAQDDRKANLTNDANLGKNQAAIPGNLPTTGQPCDNQKFIFAFVGRVAPQTHARGVVFHIADEGTTTDMSACITMIAEGNTGLDTEDENPGSANQGKVSIVFKGATFTDASDNDGQIDWTEYDLHAIDDDQRFIVTIVCDGSGARKGAVRINGRNVDSLTFPADFKLEGHEFATQRDGIRPRNVAGRMFFGCPVEGSASIGGDAYTTMTTGFLAMRTLEDPWDRGTPAWIGNWNHSTLGGPSAGYEGEKFANVDAGDGTGINNCKGFDGDICEIITVLADSTGVAFPDINDDSSGLVPTYTSSSGVYVSGETAKRGDANCNTVDGSTDVEKIEGYLAWKWGIADLLPHGVGTDNQGLYADHKYAGDEAAPATGGTPTVGFDNTGYNAGVATTNPVVGKLDAAGTGKWASQAGGMGYGIAVDEDEGNIYTVGPTIDGAFGGTGVLDEWIQVPGDEKPQAWKLSDRGAYVSGSQQFDCWRFNRVLASDELSSGETQRYPRLALDADGNLYWPLANTVKANHVRRLASDGEILTDGVYAGQRIGKLDWQYSINSQCQAFGVAVTTDKLDFRTSPGISGPEFIWICSDNGEQDGTVTATLPQLHKINQFRTTLNFASGVSSRETRLVAVGNGSLYAVDSSHIASPVSGGSGVLDINGAFVSTVAAFQNLYFADGLSYHKYDPVLDQATLWKAEKGEIPRRCKLVSFWRGRMIVARDPEDPHNWHMSAMAEPDDWDFDPKIYVATMAINGNNSRAGRTPDIVNTIIPYNDDLLLFGCDSNIYRLTGDPMAGGQLDMVSSATGMAFGDCWCRDPEGALYFFGSRGGVYTITPQEGIQSISSGSIERRLQGVDLSRYKIRLIWNTEEQGLHIVQAPIIDDFWDDIQLTSWFWDKRNGAWFEDEFSDPTKQPSALVTFDGDDPDDRTLVLGCEDGYLRRYHRKAGSDDGTRIHSRVLFGPMVQEDADFNMRFAQLGVELASEQQGAEYDWHVSRSSDVLGEPAQSGKLRAGPNPLVGGKHRGAATWVRIRNAADNERWSLEALSMAAHPAGRKRI